MAALRYASLTVLVSSLAGSGQPRSPLSLDAPASLFVRATDTSGRPIADITPADFELRVDNAVRSISAVVRPPHARSIVVLSDHSGSMTFMRDALLASMARLVSRLSNTDRARIGSFAERTLLSPAFTTNHVELAATTRNYGSMGHPSLINDALWSAMDVLSSESARRIIVLLSDGADSGSRRSLNDVIRRAQQENVLICGVGVRPDMPPPLAAASRIDPSFKKLTGETGGCVAEAKELKRLDAAVDEVLVAMNDEYRLDFSSPATAPKPLSIKITVNRPGAKVFTKARLVLPAAR